MRGEGGRGRGIIAVMLSTVAINAAMVGACVVDGLDGPDAVADDAAVADGGEPSPDAGAEANLSEAATIDVGLDTTAAVDAGPPWTLYSRNSAQTTQWNSVPLDSAWIGPNAPPPRGIRATVHLNLVDRLLVLADDGMFYLRDPSGWRAPRPIDQVFGGALSGRDFRGIGHVQPAPDAPATQLYETLYFADNPTIVIYRYFPTDSIQFDQTVQVTDEPPPYGAPKGTRKQRWNVEMFDNTKYHTAQYLQLFYRFDGDPAVYLYDATPAPANKWLFADCPLFAGTTGTPPADGIVAGYRDDGAGVTYFVVR